MSELVSVPDSVVPADAVSDALAVAAAEGAGACWARMRDEANAAPSTIVQQRAARRKARSEVMSMGTVCSRARSAAPQVRRHLDGSREQNGEAGKEMPR